MKLFLPYRRAAALIQSGPPDDPDRLHLFVMMTDPVGDNDEVLTVSVCSIRNGRYHDAACELGPDDHDFIKEPSYILYSRARIIRAETLVNGFNEGLIIPKGTVTEEVYARICEGFDISIHVNPKTRNFIQGMRS